MRSLVIALISAASFASASLAAPAPRAPAEPEWQTLPTEAYKGKRDDVHFADARTGYYGTGAGDLFAAGYLAGLARGESARRCAELGALGASEIIKHLGARPQVDLKAMAAGS